MASTSSITRMHIRGRLPEAFKTNSLSAIKDRIPRDLSPVSTVRAVTSISRKKMDGTNMVGILAAFVDEALKKKGKTLQTASQQEINSLLVESASLENPEEHLDFRKRIERARSTPFHSGNNGSKDEISSFRGNPSYKVNQNIMADPFGVTIPFHLPLKEKNRLKDLIDSPVRDLYVAPSTIAEAGKGLFSDADLHAGQDIELMHHVVIKKDSPEDKIYKGICHMLGEDHKKYAGEFAQLNHQTQEFEPVNEFYVVLCDGARYLNNAANVVDGHYEQDPKKETGTLRRQLGILKQEDIPQSLEGLSEAILGLPCLSVNSKLPSGAVILPKDTEIMYSYGGDKK